MKALYLGLACGFALQAGAAPLEVRTLRYVCERGVEVPAAFVNGPEDALVVITVDGGQILLYQEPSASGARYAWPSGGAGYVLWVKGDSATIYWREDGQENTLLTCISKN